MRRTWLQGTVWLLASRAQAPPAPAVSYTIPQLPKGASGYTVKPGWSTTAWDGRETAPDALSAQVAPGQRGPTTM